jgi:hypothetical protein
MMPRPSMLLVLLALGCTSTGVGNPGADNSTVSLALISDSNVEPDATDTELLAAKSLRHAILVFGELRYLACDAQDSDVVVKGPFVADVAQNRVVPELPSVPVPEGGFCGMDAPLAPAVSPASLAGRSIWFSGLRSDGTLFMLFADMEGTLHLRTVDGEPWPVEHGLLWTMRPRRWLSPSELDGVDADALDGTERVIVINVNQHPALYAKIRARLAGRSTLNIDLNDDGALDPDEREPDATVGQGLDHLD